MCLIFDTSNSHTHKAVESILCSYPGLAQVFIRDSKTGTAFIMKNRSVKITDALINELIGVLGEENVVRR